MPFHHAIVTGLATNAPAGTARPITTLRHENEQLRLHVELYEEHIRRLTIENTRLTAELAHHADIAHHASHRSQSTSR